MCSLKETFVAAALGVAAATALAAEDGERPQPTCASNSSELAVIRLKRVTRRRRSMVDDVQEMVGDF